MEMHLPIYDRNSKNGGGGGGGAYCQTQVNLLLNWLLKWILRLAILSMCILNLILALDPNRYRQWRAVCHNQCGDSVPLEAALWNQFSMKTWHSSLISLGLHLRAYSKCLP